MAELACFSTDLSARAAIETEAQERFRQAEAVHSARGEYMCEQREAHQKHAQELGSATRNHADGARQEAQRHHGQVYHLDTQRTRTVQRRPFEQTASKAQLGLAVQSARRIQHDKANQRERECNSARTPTRRNRIPCCHRRYSTS
ncbi:hypothetical protein HBH98_233830 [Parastagonospora nodorum]|nr:hypothetical protein HBI10_193680 [Parastagonospora nodorum]KAH4125415.1 hypothetical protein HBH45_230950 [Parastagonospora nodorum]KAH4147808.1 hypothetical protein HBH44_220290 [Parastagonospora nodorum]KAH4335452.1 hypothetical protein HBH98_233830 [Parastagonospora nodorum]KAH4358260.1 hypothetical protein HBH97_219960 [Parastagonospora nodorum]